jgi:hypothetical protein
MRIAITAIAIVVAIVFVAGTVAAENKYIGTKTCAMCHKAKDKGEAFTIWSKSKHAEAFTVLQSEAAKKVAKEKGLTVAPDQAPQCLKCHVTGGAAAEVKEGVTCEGCHGAASGYKTLHTKAENKAKAVEAGLVSGDAAMKVCTSCHNSESPTFKGFKQAEMWAKIAHKLPKK